MLLKIKKMVVENSGYKRQIYFQNIYVNVRSIVSISDYDVVQNFLLKENSEFANEKYSLVKIEEGGSIQDLIVLGAADKIYDDYRSGSSEKKILNG